MYRKGICKCFVTCGGPAAKLSVPAEVFIYSLDSPQHDGGIHIDTTTTLMAYNGSIIDLVVCTILRPFVFEPHRVGCERKMGLRSKSTTTKPLFFGRG